MIYLFTAVGFPPGGSGLQTCTEMVKRRRNNKQSTQNGKTKTQTKKANIKRKLKSIRRVIRR
jgi:hypothetical protein